MQIGRVSAMRHIGYVSYAEMERAIADAMSGLTWSQYQPPRAGKGRVMPKRIQLSRRKGYRKPAGAVVVSRPSKWGNPFKPSTLFGDVPAILLHTINIHNPHTGREIGIDVCLQLYRAWVQREYTNGNLDLSNLHGKDLACWCKLCEQHADGKPLGVDCPDCQPCHADVLLRLANEEV